MIEPADWIPEAYPRSGGLAAAGFSKLLGRPRLDPLTVLLRETAQNSWDARLSDDLSVVFSVEGWDLEPDEILSLRELVFPSAEKAVGTGLNGALARGSLTAFYIWDRNTKGLGGPVQADKVDSEDTYDWVDFVLNVGKANTARHTGGTYGFGKTIAFVVSKVNSVVIHSKSRRNGKIQSRLIACAIGDEFKRGGYLCTGRHWWGRSVDGMPHPVTGGAADRIAASIGMPPFEEGETGTTIMVVDPDFAERTGEQAMTFIAESAAWYLWPKMMERSSKVPMTIVVTWNGNGIQIPSPSERPPLYGFAQAFRAMLDGSDTDNQPAGTRHDVIRCMKPKTAIGDLVTVPLVVRERAIVDDGHDPHEEDSPRPAAVISGPAHHVALLRTPELVVDYLLGPVPLEGGMEWAGVFRCRPEHDASFAAAEPPTHDSWRTELLPSRRDRTIVNVGLREIRNVLDNRWAPRPTIRDTDTTSTAAIAAELAGLVRTTEARGSGRPPRGTGTPNLREPKARIEVVHSGPVVKDGVVMTRVKFRVTHRDGSPGTHLSIACGAALDGTTVDMDLDPVLQLVEARFLDQTTLLNGTNAELSVMSEEPVEIELFVSRSRDTTVLLDIHPEAMSAA